MNRIRISMAIAILFSAVFAGTAQNSESEAPLWIRANEISPDGSTIVFSWQGDIFTVGIDGGKAMQITSNPAYDCNPHWSKDGKQLIFASYRNGTKDIFRVSAEGGVPQAITDYPGSNETPIYIREDGYIVFTSPIYYDSASSDYPGNSSLYMVRTPGERPIPVTSLPVSALSISPKNGKIIYEDIKGYEDPFRKHHTSSVTRDIWLYEPATNNSFSIDSKGKFTKLTTFEGEDRNPVFASDGDNFYYLSEQDGNSNVYRSSLSSPDKNEQITFFKTHPVRYLSVADNGTMSFSYNGELYVKKSGKEPDKLEIRILKDNVEKGVQYSDVSSGASAFALSPNEKEAAIIVRGDVYVTSLEYNTCRRITNTPEQERDICFSEDGRTIYYSSERDGHWGVWSTSLTNKDDKYFTYTTAFEEKKVTEDGQTCFQPAVSPDGKWLAFLRDRTELVIKNIKTGKEQSLFKDINYSYTDGDQNFEWSPDSRSILCNWQADGGWNNEDIALIDIESGKITDLTESGYSDNNFHWALGGKAVVWTSDKAGYRSHGSWGAQNDIYAMFLDAKEYYKFIRDAEYDKMESLMKDEKKKDEKKEAKDSTKVQKKEKLVLDLENRKDRIVRLTRYSGMTRDHYMKEDGSKLYYIMRNGRSNDLFVTDIKKNETKVLASGVSGSIHADKKGSSIYVLGYNGITKIDLNSGSKKQITFKGEYEYRPAGEREYIFSHIWKQVEEKFYDPDIHGIDWKGYRDAYARFLPFINNNFDFQEMLSEMLGELNGSHTGARYSYRSNLNLGSLGAFYDMEYDGDGLKIKEIIPGGTLYEALPDLKEGDMVLAIDGKKIEKGKEWFSLLKMKAGKKVEVTVKRKGHKEENVIVTPAFSDYDNLYRRWVKQREEIVRELSGGKVGYVHVEGMNSQSFRTVYSELLGKYRNCDA
ncbi:MAG: PDZ domain-containing protein, partial [Candidatus Cryptobacteroides sp.]